MKTMKILAKVFAIVGLVADIGAFLYSLIAFILACQAAGTFTGAELLTTAIIYLVVLGFGIYVGIRIISSLNREDKETHLGVLGIIFLSLLGGIFYLIWEPEKRATGDALAGTFGEDYKTREFDSYDKVEMLDSCTAIRQKFAKGDVAYVIDSDKSDNPCESRWTKVLFVQNDDSYVVYDFHNYVLKKVGLLSDDFPYSSSGVELNKKMQLNHDYKDLKQGCEVIVLKLLPHGKYKILDKCLVEHSSKKPNGKEKKRSEERRVGKEC